MPMLRLSIVIPVYNVSQYLPDCLDSILSQDVDSSCYEIILVDDCSPHGENIIIEDYKKKYNNLIYIRHNVNKRQGGARNTGLCAARGEYVMFLDADDFLKYINTLTILLECVKKYSPVVLRSPSFFIFPYNTTYRQISEIYHDKVTYNSLSFVQWRKSTLFSCSACATLYKRSFLLDNNLFFRENVLYEDSDWVQKTMFYAENIDLIDFTFYGYRQSLNSTTRGHSIAAFEGNVEGVIETYRFFENKELEVSFRLFLNERFIKTCVNLLKMSCDYSISESSKILKKLNGAGLTNLRGSNVLWNIVLILMNFMPLLPIILVKILSRVRNLFD